MKSYKLKVKFSSFFILIIMIISCCLAYYIHVYENKEAFSDNLDIKIDLNNDGEQERIKLKDNKLEVSTNDKNILELDNNNTRYTSVALIKDKKLETTEFIVQNKTKDTSSRVDYTIYKVENNKAKEIAHKDDLYKGVLTVTKDNNFVEELPEYTKNDCNAVPSSVVKKYYVIENEKLTPVKTEKVNYSYQENIAGTVSDTYYKNPSKDEIKKILDNVAYEKGIPSEIMEAVAWQESKGADPDNSGVTNWRQFANGQPLIGYDHIGIGIMQVSDYNASDTAYVNRLKYDVEFNIREGAKILIDKWGLSESSPTYKIPRVGDSSPSCLEHWYYAIWAYNGYCQTNNPAANHSTAYQTLVIGHVNNVFNKSMIDLYVYSPNLFAADSLPRTDIAEINGKHTGDFKIKDKNYNYIATTNLNIRDENNVYVGAFSANDIIVVKGDPILKNSYIRYYVEGNGKSGYVAGNWLKPVGDINEDKTVDLYDLVKVAKYSNGIVIDDSNRIDMEKYDVNMDGTIDIKDIALTAENYNDRFYQNNMN